MKFKIFSTVLFLLIAIEAKAYDMRINLKGPHDRFSSYTLTASEIEEIVKNFQTISAVVFVNQQGQKCQKLYFERINGNVNPSISGLVLIQESLTPLGILDIDGRYITQESHDDPVTTFSNVRDILPDDLSDHEFDAISQRPSQTRLLYVVPYTKPDAEPGDIQAAIALVAA